MKRGLPPKQEAFCIAYAKSGNATQAYKEAGYNIKSDDVARKNASRLLTNADVVHRIAEISREINSPKIMDVQQMQERLTAIATQTAEIEIEVSDGTRIKKPSFQDSLKAIELLAKLQGAFINKQEVEISGALPVVLRDDVHE